MTTLKNNDFMKMKQSATASAKTNSIEIGQKNKQMVGVMNGTIGGMNEMGRNL